MELWLDDKRVVVAAFMVIRFYACQGSGNISWRYYDHRSDNDNVKQ